MYNVKDKYLSATLLCVAVWQAEYEPKCRAWKTDLLPLALMLAHSGEIKYKNDLCHGAKKNKTNHNLRKDMEGGSTQAEEGRDREEGETQLVMRLRNNRWETRQEQMRDNETERVKVNITHPRQETLQNKTGNTAFLPFVLFSDFSRTCGFFSNEFY